MLRCMFALAALLALVSGFVHAQQPAPSNAPSLGTPAPVPPVTPVPAAPVVFPESPPAGGCPCACGDGGTSFAIDLMFGMQLGVRGQVALHRNPDSALMLEGFYGVLVNKLGGGEGAGVGARYYFRRTDRTGDNSVIFGPGAGLYYHFSDEVLMLAPSLDVAWVRAISNTGSWQLGINLGVGIGISDNKTFYDSNEVGRVTPLISVYTGFRF